MEFELSEEDRMLKELVHRFVEKELMPLERAVLDREAKGQGFTIGPEEHARLDKVSKELGLWGLDAPEDGLEIRQVDVQRRVLLDELALGLRAGADVAHHRRRVSADAGRQVLCNAISPI